MSWNKSAKDLSAAFAERYGLIDGPAVWQSDDPRFWTVGFWSTSDGDPVIGKDPDLPVCWMKTYGYSYLEFVRRGLDGRVTHRVIVGVNASFDNSGGVSFQSYANVSVTCQNVLPFSFPRGKSRQERMLLRTLQMRMRREARAQLFLNSV